jgi:hypothetical protein
VTVVLILAAGPAYADACRTPVVVPPHKTVQGKTYGDLHSPSWMVATGEVLM